MVATAVTTQCVTSSVLSPESAAKLQPMIAQRLAWLGRFRRWMEQRGFPPGDALYVACAGAHDAMQELHVRAHYAAVASGVGLSTAKDALR